jgi:hypothetical protein
MYRDVMPGNQTAEASTRVIVAGNVVDGASAAPTTDRIGAITAGPRARARRSEMNGQMKRRRGGGSSEPPSREEMYLLLGLLAFVIVVAGFVVFGLWFESR